jgi:hypothetical protein
MDRLKKYSSGRVLQHEFLLPLGITAYSYHRIQIYLNQIITISKGGEG